MVPSIDHSLLSPSGNMSKAARKRTILREASRLFEGVNISPKIEQPTEREYLLRQASQLREVAARGMKPRAYLKRALELEAQANAR